MKIQLFAHILCALLLAGCIPCKQQDTFAYNNSEFKASFHDEFLMIYFGSDQSEKKYEIDDTSSYLFGPDGERYAVIHKYHQYDLEQGYREPRVNVYIVDNKGRTISSWSDGIWKLHLVAHDKDGQKEVFETEFKLWTFYYSPFIHGAPN